MKNKIYIIANWKMQLSNQEAVELALNLKREKFSLIEQGLELVLCPSFTALAAVYEAIGDSNIKLGAQNVFYHESGQYTGEVTSTQLKDLGVEYIIIGHSERRKYCGENDDNVNRKIKMVLEHGLTPIVCLGETLEERMEKKAEVTIIRQLTGALEDVDLSGERKIFLTYEPVWAISPAPPATPEDVNEMLQLIRQLVRDIYGDEILKEKVKFIYGGSVDAKNIKRFLEIDMVCGVLVGGASLTMEKFVPLIKKIII